jgi:hypothetical protein
MIAATYGRTGELRATLDRAKDRALKCEREFDRFSSGDLSTDAQRQHRQLKADWDRAQRDCEWAKEQLERTLDRERMEIGTDR